ncbi:MAG: hypothetical protein K6G94_01515 [Kiritimatiellae bacterium]|nr:hypothetical protein [Kiritimatiellia bacterium]
MRNLYEETAVFLLECGKSMNDIVFVSGNGHEIPLDNFIQVAKSYDYDNGFGGAEVPEDLLVVGSDWWIERHEYDGSEWWEYKTLPKRSKTVKKISGFHPGRGYLYGEEGGAK